jgi:hypothetical protein
MTGGFFEEVKRCKVGLALASYNCTNFWKKKNGFREIEVSVVARAKQVHIFKPSWRPA